jgi:hypothetical protein
MKRNLIDRSAGKQFTGLFSFPPHPWRKKLSPSSGYPAAGAKSHSHGKGAKFRRHIFIGLIVARIVHGCIPVAGKPPCERRKTDTEIVSNLPSCSATRFGKPNSFPL